MSTEIENVIVVTPNEGAGDIVESVSGEVIDNATGEITDDNSAVAIAEIEAGKEIALAEIHAETSIAIEQEITERALTREDERENQWHEMQANMMVLSRQVSEMKELVGSILQPSSVPVEVEPIAPEQNLTPQFMPDEIASIQTEVSDESADERPEPETPVRKRRRLI